MRITLRLHVKLSVDSNTLFLMERLSLPCSRITGLLCIPGTAVFVASHLVPMSVQKVLFWGVPQKRCSPSIPLDTQPVIPLNGLVGVTPVIGSF